MRRLSIIIIWLCTSILTNAQIHNPVEWTFQTRHVKDDIYELLFIAEIEKGWHLYSQHLPSDEGPVATAFTFNSSDNYSLIGKVQEPIPHTEYDPNFDMKLSYFEEQVVFKQKIKALAPGKITGELTYMVCDSVKCLPPEYLPFSFDVHPAKAENSESSAKESLASVAENQIYEPVKWTWRAVKAENGLYDLIFETDIQPGWHVYSSIVDEKLGPVPTKVTLEKSKDFELVGKLMEEGKIHTDYDPNFDTKLTWSEEKLVVVQKIKPLKEDFTVKGELQYMACDSTKCLPPEYLPFEIRISGAVALPADDKNISEQILAEDSVVKRSFLGIFIAGFIGGLLALLTPCVFPMIPLTVSFFTKQSKNKSKGVINALIYGLSIIIIYVLLGYGVTAIFGADAMNALSTNVWFNLAFFALLAIFAISFFGAFEITLPSSWVNKVDSASDKGGLIGIFFMAFTLSLVSFSCTGPIIGTLLVEAAVNGGIIGPIAGMIGFSLALALPFTLFAAFPGWLNSLPQSGGWLNSVKVVLGFIELALALKFLSNADLVVQAGILKREIFIALWAAIFLALTLYLFGFFRLPHDSPLNHLSVGRTLLAILSLTFTIYLIPGIWGAPLKLISGFPPPMFYSESPNGFGNASEILVHNIAKEGVPEGADPEHCPHNLNCFHDYETGMAYAKKVNKPVMLDFTGWACVNCRKMEEQVWSDPEVLKILREDVVLISLYVDEKTELPKEEQIEVEIGGRKKILKTIGNKWSYMQAKRYGTNSQPYYVILDHQENVLNGSAAYDPDVKKFKTWLQEGIKKFHENI